MTRTAARVDANQDEVVKLLRRIPGVKVELKHDDFLVGFRGKTYWIELKNPNTVSKKTGEILDSAKKKSQRDLEAEWTGHYLLCSSLDEILEDMGIKLK